MLKPSTLFLCSQVTCHPTQNKTHSRRTHCHPAPSSSQAAPPWLLPQQHTQSNPTFQSCSFTSPLKSFPPIPNLLLGPCGAARRSWKYNSFQGGACPLPGRMKQRLCGPKECRARFGQLEPGLAAASRGQNPNIHTQTDVHI